MNKICFISGGITKVPDYMENFDKAGEELKQLGLIPLNPAKMSVSLMADGVNFEDDSWLEIDFAALKQCQAIYLLRNWKSSSGSRKEYHFALAHGLPVLFQENFQDYLLMSASGQLDALFNIVL